MKHNNKITAILIIMFLLTQFIGLFVIHTYSNGLLLPYGMEPPTEVSEDVSIFSILFAFIIAITFFFLLTKIKAEKFIRLWFLVVTVLALALTLNAILNSFGMTTYAAITALIIAIPFAYYKIFKRDIYVHNISELLIYPGIAAIFVPLLGVMGIIVLLLIISLYDIWAVWQSKIMQKMAKYQINNLKIFSGFFIPYTNKKERKKIKQIKAKYKEKGEKELEKQFKKQKVKVSLAILGGGDVIFPIIAAGVFYTFYGALLPALVISFSATIALAFLFVLANKGKFYPAMPFITIGIYLGMMFNWLFLV